MAKPTINDVITGLRALPDLLDASEDALETLQTTAGLIHRYRTQVRKLKNCKPVMRPWHRWRVNALADKIRARLGLGPLDPIPEIKAA